MGSNGPEKSDAGNAIPAGREITSSATMRSTAPPEAVYDMLADVRSHLEWAGNRGKKNFRLLSIEAPEGPAQVGSEWSSTGIAPDGSFKDRSKVTEASRPSAFAFTTNAHITFRKSGREADWTVHHRYDVAPDGAGSRITYNLRVTHATELGPMKMMLTPVIGLLAKKMTVGLAMPAMKSLATMAEARSGKQ